jgi:hypothetical protein
MWPTRAIQIRFAQPFEPFRTVRIEALEGMRTFDGAAVYPLNADGSQ